MAAQTSTVAVVVRLGYVQAAPTRPDSGLNVGWEREGRKGLWCEQPKDGTAAAREERKDGDGGALQSEACEVPGASWTPQGDTEGLNVAESPGAQG